MGRAKRALLDENIDVRLARAMPRHEVSTVRAEGWSGVTNGQLLRLVEAGPFDVFVTADRSLEYQQSLENRSFGTVVLLPKRLKLDQLLLLVPSLVMAIDRVSPGEVLHLHPPGP